MTKLKKMMRKNGDMLLIFDLDGTIFKTKDTIFPAVREVLRDIGHENDIEDLIESLIGEKTSDFCEMIKPDDIDMEEFIDKLWEKEKEYIDKKGKLYHGIRDVLEELSSKNIDMFICSNANRDYIRYVMDRFEISECFSSIISGKDFEDKISAVRSLISNHENNFGIVIGDRYKDKKAAEKNDLLFLGALYGYGRSELEDAYFTIKEPKEILGHVNLFEIFHTIEKDYESLDQEKITVIGVNGIDNSGKTIFAESLAKYLICRGYSTKMISIDDFHNPREIRRKGKNPIDAYLENAFDIERLEQEILYPISKNEEIDKELKLLNLKTDMYDIKKEYEINKNDVVIIEGVLLYKKPVEKYIDYKIYLDIDFETMIKRAKERDKNRFNDNVIKRYKEKYIPIQKKYIEVYNPKNKSDIVINNNDVEDPKIIEYRGK